MQQSLPIAHTVDTTKIEGYGSKLQAALRELTAGYVMRT